MNYAIVTAAGQGTRFGSRKALHPLGGKPLVAWPVACLEQCAAIDQIVVTVPAGQNAEFEKALDNFQKVRFVQGGETRFDSVRNAVFSIPSPAGMFLIHDAARPLLSAPLLERILVAVEKHGAVIPVLPIGETVKQVEGDLILRTIPRQNLFVAQTPQAFRADILLAAYSKINDAAMTDEAMMVERAGFEVHVIPGERKNIKITEAQDIQVAEALL